MALGDKPNQTKKPKDIKAPAIAQLRAGGDGGANNTAGLGAQLGVPKPQMVSDLAISTADNLVPKVATPNQTVNYQPDAPLPTGKKPMVEFNTNRVGAVQNEVSSPPSNLSARLGITPNEAVDRASMNTGTSAPGILSSEGLKTSAANLVSGALGGTTVPAEQIPALATLSTASTPLASTALTNTQTPSTNGVKEGEKTFIPTDTFAKQPNQLGYVNPLNQNTSTTPGSKEGVSYISEDGGARTLNAGGGTISSSSPKFGKSSPERLANLDKILASDASPERAALRAESAALADQRYNDALRGGLSREEYENPNGITQLRKQLDAAKARKDIVGFGLYRDLLKEQLGNATTQRGQDITAEGNKLSTEAARQTLGYNQIKDERSFEATQQNKLTDQDIERQKVQLGANTKAQEIINNPQNMWGAISPAASFSKVHTIGANTWEGLDSIVGPQTAERLRAEPDINKVITDLQAKGLDATSIKIMLNHRKLQQQ